MSAKLLRSLFLILALTLSIVAAAYVRQLSLAAEGVAPLANQVYLPILQGGRSQDVETPTATPTKPGNPPDDSLRLARFAEQTWKTSNANVRIDAAGGVHIAFYYYESIFEERPTTAVYAFCASQCNQAGSWQSVQLAEEVNEVQLALSPAGKPRLLIRTRSTLFPNGKDYHFAACDDNCAQASGWSVTYILSSHGTASVDYQEDEMPQRSFALDPAGRPRFVYLDRNTLVEPDHLGVFYAFCDAQCTQQASWQQTRITEVIPSPFRMETLYYPALAFTPDGKPRLATAEFFPLNDGEAMLAYFECNDACTESESWRKVTLLPRGGGSEPSADLAIDANGRPRIAFYQESTLDGGKRLFYLWCNGGCLDAANWQQRDLGLDTFDGQEPDLELDRGGRPRIAYADYNTGGLGYAWCNEGCDTANAQWQHKVIETRTDLQTAWNVPFPRDHCDAGLWNSLTPTLAFGADGNAYVAYDATYHARCYYDDNPNDNIPPDWHFGLVMRSVRLVAFAQPFTQPTDPPTPSSPTSTWTPTPTATGTATPTPTVTPTPSPTPVSITKRSALFADAQAQTSSASVATTGNGGLHRAFVFDETQTAGYSYCATGCQNPASWQTISLASAVNEVQLKVDPAGKPRLLIRRASTTYADGYDYLYAQCDGNCTVVNNWDLAHVATARGGANFEQHDAQQPQRSFALDPTGRPRFVYVDENATVDPVHVGVYYAWCDAGCTDALAWQEVRITELVQWFGEIEDQERALYLALAFTPQGYPRLITAEFFPLQGQEARLTYIACDELCELGYIWQKTQLYERGEGAIPSADLVIDAEGHPHVAFYQGKTEAIMPDSSRPLQPESIIYATCQQSHCMTANNWDARHIGVSGANGPGPDLELDAQGRPRIAYTKGETGGIGYSWCDADCVSYSEGVWQHGVIETGAELQSAWPMSVPPQCARGGWQGWAPTLVLPTSGDAHVAYDAAYVAHCSGQDEVVRRAARLVTFVEP